MTEHRRAHTAHLRTARLELTPLDPAADARHLHHAYGDEDVMRWWTRPACADPAETERYLTSCAAAPGARLWTVRTPDGTVVGMAGLLGGTDVPGLTWLLRRDSWGHGYATEAAAAVVGHALEDSGLGLDRVEAWIEAGNHRSLAVAARAGLTERARLAQHYPHRHDPHEMVVLGKARAEEPPTILAVITELPVRDVTATLRLVEAALGARTAFVIGDPPEYAEAALTPWSAGPRFRLAAVPGPEPVEPVRLQLDAAGTADSLHRRAVDAGARVDGPPVRRPWGRSEFVITLPEGHELTVSAPV
ncbi:bleomycin family antibiotic N-acetyltransferase BlmB [Streptomyces mobaraensis]|uniref:bleomycin family antibiotic N-acetyltransferase BlmB n=1 Tax=Streptomyces mobaraensis TaxID=35621 RepID=UPI00332B2C67